VCCTALVVLYSVSQCVVVCYSVFQCVAVCCIVGVIKDELHGVAMCCVVLQSVVVCCSMLMCGAGVKPARKYQSQDSVTVGLLAFWHPQTAITNVESCDKQVGTRAPGSEPGSLGSSRSTLTN